MPTIPAGELTEFAERALEAIGLAGDDARTVAGCLVQANLRGVEGHGVLRLLQYAQSVRSGGVNPRPRVTVVRHDGAAGLIDAGGGYGFVPTLQAMEMAVGSARSHGIGVVGVRNSHHFGMTAIYAERAVEAGLIGIVTTNTGPVMAPAGVSRPLVGNNPIAFAIPRLPPSPPLVLDMALSGTAFGRIRLAAAEGRPIPLGWAHDSEGQPTTDAAAALQASLLAPMGGYKGYGLSVVVEVLTGILTGSPFGFNADAHGHRAGGVGHLAMSLDPTLFVGREDFLGGVEQLVNEIKSTPTRGGDEVLLPGEIEWRTKERRLAEGIPISDELASQCGLLAKKLGVAALALH